MANPGDTFLVSGPKHGGAPVTFTRPGTAANPITWRAVGTVAVAAFIDVNDATFTPSGIPNVWQVPWTLTSGKAYQTFFDDIVVDDPNQTYFTLKDEDGPLVMTPVLSEAEVAAHDGTFFRDAANQRMLVHPYGNRTPSTTNTDIVIATGNSMTLDTKANYQVFDGFTITYAGGVSGLILSSNNKFYNTRYIATPLNIYGMNNYFENTTINHGIWRQGPAWDWDQEGEGATGGFSAGTGHVMKNLHVFNSWNSTFNSETSNGNTIDGGRFHGAPNHCTGAGNGGNTVRNAAWWNCQDYQWLFDPVGIVMEHVVIPGGGVAVSAIEGNTGPITIRNSILSGVMHFVRGTGAAADLPYEGCTWEVGSLLEYNVIAEGMTIERCNTQIAYPVDEYIARCASGEFTGCMTIRNNIKVPGTTAGWKTVMVDGMWSGVAGAGIGPIGEQWNFQLVPGSPAINAGMVSGATTDLIGISRPQPVGGLYDIGAYEFTPGGDPAPTGKPIVAAPAAVTTTITAPTSSTTYDAGTSATLTTLAGTSKSGRTITGCTWANSFGGSGATTGTTSWTVPSIALSVGSNVITVTCTNDGKTTGVDIITVTRSSGGGGATVVCGTDGTANSCTRAGMTTLIAAAANGDTIRIANATHSWVTGTPVTINKRIRITGSRTCTGCGTNSPSMSAGATLLFGNGLDAPGAGDNGAFTVNVTTAGTGIVEIDGIKFEGDLWFEYHWWDANDNSAEPIFLIVYSTNLPDYRIHNNWFHGANQTGDGDGAMNGFMVNAPGLIDHNWFEADGIEGHTLFVTDPRADGNGDAAWEEATVYGGSLTNNWVFIETNTFTRPSGAVVFESSVVDAYAGGRYVFRYNYVRNGWVLNHDKSGGGDSRAGVAFEIYNNVFNFESAATFQCAMYLRDGSMLYHNNSHVGFWQSYIKFWNRRISEATGNWLTCNGARAWDSNIGGPAPGYRCADQVGTGRATGPGRVNTQPQALLPARIWSNTGSVGGGCAGLAEHSNKICNDNPSTIISGTDYHFSDNASAALGGYTPYTYPHPLTTGPPPPAPAPPPEAIVIWQPLDALARRLWARWIQ